MCDQCKSILDRYDAASVRLTDAAQALVHEQARPNFDALTEYIEDVLRECREARSELDRHRAESHHWNQAGRRTLQSGA